MDYEHSNLHNPIIMMEPDTRTPNSVDATQTPPRYALYGEFLEQARPDYLHYETIRERSIKHNWSIRPHRHDNLYQVFHFATPGVHIRLGSETALTRQPVVLLVPPLVMHGFQFPPTIQGGVISIAVSHMNAIAAAYEIPHRLFASPLQLGPEDELFNSVTARFAQLAHDFANVHLYRNFVLENGFRAVVLGFARTFQDRLELANPHLASGQERHVRRFCATLEHNFRSQKTVRFYADNVGLSPVHLTRLTRAILGMSPLEAVAARRLIEAKRLLRFTQYAVHEVAHQLGFSDVSYFSRFFKKQTGQSPQRYRKQSML
jgi:AraC family transcriptional activator of pobA